MLHAVKLLQTNGTGNYCLHSFRADPSISQTGRLTVKEQEKILTRYFTSDQPHENCCLTVTAHVGPEDLYY